MDPMTGELTVTRTALADPVFDAVRSMGDVQNDMPNFLKRKRMRTYLGSIDPITAAQWAKECKAAIGTKEFAAYAKKKLMSGEWSHFRADRQKTLYGVT